MQATGALLRIRQRLLRGAIDDPGGSVPLDILRSGRIGYRFTGPGHYAHSGDGEQNQRHATELNHAQALPQ